jgi:hypothetical protein
MAQYMTALSQQPEYKGVNFVRVDIEACPVRSGRGVFAGHAAPRHAG